MLARFAASLLSASLLTTFACGDSGGGLGGSGGGGSDELVCKGLESDVPGCTCKREEGESTLQTCAATASPGYFCCESDAYPESGSCRCQPGCAKADDNSTCACGPSVASIEGAFSFVGSCDGTWAICCEKGTAENKSCFCQNTGTCADTGATQVTACTPDVIACLPGNSRTDTCMK